MVITKLISGLGNQLFQYTIAREIALRNKTELKLDTSFYGSQQLRAFKLDHFNIEATMATNKEIASLVDPYFNQSIVNQISRKFKKVFSLHQTYYAEKGWWEYDPKILNLKNNIYINGYWQHYKYYNDIHSELFDELTLKNDSVTIDKLLKIDSTEQLVSIHIRRGDYITDKQANSLMGVLPIEYYQKAIEIIKGKIANPIFCFFSDDIAWARSNFENTGNCFFIEGFQDYEDLMLMSQCNHNIIANSSFSWWGAFLNKNTSKIVVSPKNWVVEPNINKRIEMQFPEWIKI